MRVLFKWGLLIKVMCDGRLKLWNPIIDIKGFGVSETLTRIEARGECM